MKSIKKLLGRIAEGGPVAVVLSVVVSVLMVTGLVQAATTISANITTAGTFNADDAGTFGSTLGVVSTLTSGRASTTVLSVNNTAFFGGTATTTINSAGDLFVVGSTTLQNFTFQNATSTHSNSATSTLSVGCIQMYATSTATKVRLEFSSAAIAAASSTNFRGGSGIPQGQVLWSYGACPSN